MLTREYLLRAGLDRLKGKEKIIGPTCVKNMVLIPFKHTNINRYIRFNKKWWKKINFKSVNPLGIVNHFTEVDADKIVGAYKTDIPKFALKYIVSKKSEDKS